MQTNLWNRKQTSGYPRMEGQRCSEQGGAGGEIAEGPEEMFGGDGYVCYLLCADGFMGAPVCQDLSEVHSTPVWFIACQLNLNNTVNDYNTHKLSGPTVPSLSPELLPRVLHQWEVSSE